MFNLDPLNNRIIIFLLIIWEFYWKGMALYRSAKRGEVWWFLLIFALTVMFINLFAIIPIFYLWRTKQLEDVVNTTLRFLRIKKD